MQKIYVDYSSPIHFCGTLITLSNELMPKSINPQNPLTLKYKIDLYLKSISMILGFKLI